MLNYDIGSQFRRWFPNAAENRKETFPQLVAGLFFFGCVVAFYVPMVDMGLSLAKTAAISSGEATIQTRPELSAVVTKVSAGSFCGSSRLKSLCESGHVSSTRNKVRKTSDDHGGEVSHLSTRERHV